MDRHRPGADDHGPCGFHRRPRTAPGRHRVSYPAHAGHHGHVALAERERQPAAVPGQAHPQRQVGAGGAGRQPCAPQAPGGALGPARPLPAAGARGQGPVTVSPGVRRRRRVPAARREAVPDAAVLTVRDHGRLRLPARPHRLRQPGHAGGTCPGTSRYRRHRVGRDRHHAGRDPRMRALQAVTDRVVGRSGTAARPLRLEVRIARPHLRDQPRVPDHPGSSGRRHAAACSIWSATGTGAATGCSRTRTTSGTRSCRPTSSPNASRSAGATRAAPPPVPRRWRCPTGNEPRGSAAAAATTGLCPARSWLRRRRTTLRSP